MIESLIIVGAIISLASLVGVVFVTTISEERIVKLLPSFISFSAGTFLFTTGYMLIESYHALDNYLYTAALAIAGYIAAFTLSKTVPKIHYHHGEECDGHPASGKNVLVGDALHNIADGFILVPAFMVSPILGLGTALSIFIHEALQEISEFFVLKHSGYETKKALLFNFLVSLTIFIGIGLGLVLVDSTMIQGVLLALASGFFVFVLSQDLIPQQHGALKTKDGLWHILLFMTGVALLFAVQSLFAHSHDHPTETNHIHVEHTHDENETVAELVPDEEEHEDGKEHAEHENH